MKNEHTITNGKNIIAILCLVTLAFLQLLAAGACQSEKSDEEQILDTLNGYMKAHAKGDYATSFDYIISDDEEKSTREAWIASQSRAANSIRLMRKPRLENVEVRGDTATAILYYQGIPPDTLTKVMAYIYTKSFTTNISEINAQAEKYLIERFDEFSAPQSQNLTFVRVGGRWKLALNGKGE